MIGIVIFYYHSCKLNLEESNYGLNLKHFKMKKILVLEDYNARNSKKK